MLDSNKFTTIQIESTKGWDTSTIMKKAISIPNMPILQKLSEKHL